jgi:peptidoglycan/xylan/chitin deacetylase (PgdA/CDA1 family)
MLLAALLILGGILTIRTDGSIQTSSSINIDGSLPLLAVITDDKQITELAAREQAHIDIELTATLRPVRKSKMLLGEISSPALAHKDGLPNSSQTKSPPQSLNIKDNPQSFQAKDKVQHNNSKGVPVLMYHSISYEKGNELKVPVENFRAQMEYLKESGFTTLTMNQLWDFFANNAPLPEKPIVLTFDDGYKDNYTDAFPIMKEFGMKGTIYVITGTIDKNSAYITSEQIREMHEYGLDMDSHTVNHEDLSSLSYAKQYETVKNAKDTLEDLLNKEVKSFAYPYGKYNGNTIKAVRAAGYKMAFTTKGGFAEASDGMLTLDRVRINGSDSLEQFKKKIDK